MGMVFLKIPWFFWSGFLLHEILLMVFLGLGDYIFFWESWCNNSIRFNIYIHNLSCLALWYIQWVKGMNSQTSAPCRDQNPAGSMEFPLLLMCFTMYPSMKHPTNSCTTYQKKDPRRIRIHVLLSSSCHVLSWYIVQNNNLTVLSAQTTPLVLAYAMCR